MKTTAITADRERSLGVADGIATLTDRAYLEIEELIVTLRLEPGAVLSEATLSRQLGIGRTPIREALQRLAREGLVVIMPRRGILVAEINVTSQLRLVEVLRELDRLIVSLAAERATGRQRDSLQEIADAMIEAGTDDDHMAFLRQERAFGQLAVRAAGNEFAGKTRALMSGLSRRFWFRHFSRVADLATTVRLQARLVRAIADGDKALAVEACDLLMDHMEDCTRAAIDG